jgi:CheY-like chemotaxis protein
LTLVEGGQVSEAKRPILVVDDHEDTREMVAALLTKEGYTVVQAANGRVALDLLVSEEQTEPCLIVMDLEMPVMSGWELLAIIKSYHRLSSIPVVITSGSQKQSEALRHGAVVAYLPKPTPLDVLLKKIREKAGEHCGVKE